MVNFNNRVIATLQILNIFIVFIVSRRSDADLMRCENRRLSSRGQISARISSVRERDPTMKNYEKFKPY